MLKPRELIFKNKPAPWALQNFNDLLDRLLQFVCWGHINLIPQVLSLLLQPEINTQYLCYYNYHRNVQGQSNRKMLFRHPDQSGISSDCEYYAGWCPGGHSI